MLRHAMRPVLALILGWLAAAEARAQAEPAQTFYFRAQLGYAWPSFNDVNADIRQQELALRQVSTFVDWAELEGGVRYSGEVGYRITPVFALGLEFGYQRHSRDHSATILFDSGTAIVSGRIEQHLEPRLFTVLLTPTFHVPSVPGLHFGGQIGLGRGSYRRNESDDIGATDGTFLVGSFEEDVQESALAGGVFAGWDIPMSPEVAFSMRAGYLVSNFSSMNGTLTAQGSTEAGSFYGSGPSELTDSSGNPMEVSFSGLNLNVGLLLRFGAIR